MNPETKKEYDDFTVRIRFRFPMNKLGINSSEIIVSSISNGREVKLKSADLKSPIKDSEWLILVSGGWRTEEEAKKESEVLVDILCRSLSCHNLGADLGRRTPGGGFFNTYLNELSKKAGRPILNDDVGPMIYATETNPLVSRMGEVSLTVSVPEESWISSFNKALELRELFTEKERMAFDLYTMAQKSSQSADARFVLNFAALETLIEPLSRPEVSQDHVEKLIKSTQESGLSDNEKASLVGSLRWLKGHSIRAAGRQFVKSKLGEMEFGNISAEGLFLKCYDLRNRLMHGQEPHVGWNEVSNIVAPFEQMVGHLLSGSLKAV